MQEKSNEISEPYQNDNTSVADFLTQIDQDCGDTLLAFMTPFDLYKLATLNKAFYKQTQKYCESKLKQNYGEYYQWLTKHAREENVEIFWAAELNDIYDLHHPDFRSCEEFCIQQFIADNRYIRIAKFLLEVRGWLDKLMSIRNPPIYENDMSPLMFAVLHRKLDIIRYLIKQGANVFIRDQTNHNVIHRIVREPFSKKSFLAVIHTLTETLSAEEKSKLLNEETHCTISQTPITPLHLARLEGNDNAVRALLRHGAIVDKNVPLYSSLSTDMTLKSKTRLMLQISNYIYYLDNSLEEKWDNVLIKSSPSFSCLWFVRYKDDEIIIGEHETRQAIYALWQIVFEDADPQILDAHENALNSTQLCTIFTDYKIWCNQDSPQARYG